MVVVFVGLLEWIVKEIIGIIFDIGENFLDSIEILMIFLGGKIKII